MQSRLGGAIALYLLYRRKGSNIRGLAKGRLSEGVSMIWHRNGNRLTKQDALRKLNKTVSDKIEEIQRGGGNDD